MLDRTAAHSVIRSTRLYDAVWYDPDACPERLELYVYDLTDVDRDAEDWIEHLRGEDPLDHATIDGLPFHPMHFTSREFALAVAAWAQYHGVLLVNAELPPDAYAEGRALVRRWYDAMIAAFQDEAARFGPPAARVLT